jgi:AcrR family transcriptional regulator
MQKPIAMPGTSLKKIWSFTKTYFNFDRPFSHKFNSMPRTEEQLQEIREEKRQLIMDTALRLFAEESYHQVSIHQIASSAGISKGLMYNYFKSKEDLLGHIITQSFNDAIEFFDPNHDGVLEQHELLNFIDRSFDMVYANREFWKLFFSLFLQPKVLELLFTKYEELFGPFYTMLTNYFAAKGCKNPYAETLFFISVLDGLAIQYINNPTDFPLEDMKNKVKSLYK